MSDQESNKSMSEWQKRKLGALWRREGKNQNYLAGEITVGDFGVEKKYKLVIYTNKYKDQNENSPDFIIYQGKEKSEIEEALQSSEGMAPDTVSHPSSPETAEDVPDLLK